MWAKTDDDQMLSTALGNLRLADDLQSSVMEGLPTGIPTLSNGAGRVLLGAALAGAMIVALLFGLAWSRMVGAEQLIFITWVAVTVVSLIIGLFLALGARKLSEFDCWIVERLTGRASVVSVIDIMLVRTGAIAIFVVSAFWQVTTLINGQSF